MSNNINELSAAQAFVQVVRTGSFAQAAQLRGENPSSVSRAIAQLEKHLGAQLLIRSTRSVRLSEAGETYYHHAQAMLQTQLEAREAINLLSTGKPQGTVNLSLPVVFGEHLIAGVMHYFHQQYPDIRLKIDLSNRPVNLVEEEFDLALRLGYLSDSNLRVKQLTKVYRRVYVSKQYAEQHGVPKKPADLVNHKTLAFSQQGAFADWQFWCRKTGKPHPPLDLHSWFTCSSPSIVLTMIRNGFGVGRSAEWMVQASSFADELIEVLPQWQCEDPALGGVPVNLIYPPGPVGSLPLKTRVVSDFVVGVVSKMAQVRQGG